MRIPYLTALYEYIRYPSVERVVGSFNKTIASLERTAHFNGLKKLESEAKAEALKLRAAAHDKEVAFANAVKARLNALVSPEAPAEKAE
jgi:hypothetical protein